MKSGEVAQGFIYEAEEKITEAGLANSSAKIFPVNTVLVAMYGATAGQVGLLKFAASTNQAICGILPNSKFIPEFLYWVLKSRRDYMVTLSGGGAQPNISQNIIRKIEIPLPPLEIQQEIVAELDNYQKIIDGAKQVIANYKLSIKIDPSWKEIKLGEICEFRNGINYTKDSSGERIKIVGVKDFQDNFYVSIEELDYVIADGTLKENDLIQENNIVFVRSNGNQKLIGRCLLVRKVDERITHSGFTIRLILKSRELDPVFLTHLLKLDAFRQRMIEGGTGANIKSLNQGILSNLIIPHPPIEVQKQIISQLAQEQQLVEANKKLVEIFEQKIKDKIAEVWGELEVLEAEVKMPPQFGTFKQAQRVHQSDAEQPELGLSTG